MSQLRLLSGGEVPAVHGGVSPPPGERDRIMDVLVLCHVLFGIAQGLLLQLVAEHGLGMLFGALAVSSVQLGATWAMRKRWPVAATSSVLHLPILSSLLAWTLFCLVVVVLGPMTEEIVYRAIVIESLRRKLSAPAAVVCAAALFGIVQGELRTGLLAFGAGLAFGLAYVRSRSIAPGAVAHAVNNAFGLLVVGKLG